MNCLAAERGEDLPEGRPLESGFFDSLRLPEGDLTIARQFTLIFTL